MREGGEGLRLRGVLPPRCHAPAEQGVAMEYALPISMHLLNTVLTATVMGLLLRRGCVRDAPRDAPRNAGGCQQKGCPHAALLAASPLPAEESSANPDDLGAGQLVRLAQAGALDGMELTPQEARIAKLVAEGEPYPQIAQRLGISVRTVQYHARNAFAKAGASSRSEFEVLIRRKALGLLKGAE